MREKISFAEGIRFLGVIFILICHYVQQSSNAMLNMSAQFFNIGVPIFIILSGFLFGIRNEGSVSEISIWYKKRAKRIYVPYELFVIILAVITLICGNKILTINWLFLILGLQGSVVGVLGAEQTWFITTILFCYLCTPFVSWIISKISRLNKGMMVFTILVAIIPLVLACIPPVFVSTVFSPVCWYALAYLIGKHYNPKALSAKKAILAFLLMILLFALRIAVRFLFDGTIFYDRVAVGYTQAIAAFCIFYIVAYLYKNHKINKYISWISSISFEIYLYHYMFVVGPVRLFGLTGSWILDCVAVTIITFAISVITNKISTVIVHKIGR